MDERYSRDSDLDLQELMEIIPFFKGIPEDSLQLVTAHVVMRTHPPNQVILLENDWGGSVYFILDGWVKIRTYNVDGKEITLNVIGKGEIFGEMAALDEVPRSTDVITLTPTKISSIPSQDFLALIHTEPLAGVRLAQLMATRLRQVNRRLRLREADSIARVVDTIIFLAEGQGIQGKNGLELPNLPHREISSLSGLARETVTRVLTKLEKRGLIKRDQNMMCLLDIQALEKMIN